MNQPAEKLDTDNSVVLSLEEREARKIALLNKHSRVAPSPPRFDWLYPIKAVLSHLLSRVIIGAAIVVLVLGGIKFYFDSTVTVSEKKRVSVPFVNNYSGRVLSPSKSKAKIIKSPSDLSR